MFNVDKALEFMKTEYTEIVNTSYYEIDVDGEYVANFNNAVECINALEIIKNHFKISKPVGIDIRNNKVAFGSLIQIKDLTLEDYKILERLF